MTMTPYFVFCVSKFVHILIAQYDEIKLIGKHRIVFVRLRCRTTKHADVEQNKCFQPEVGSKIDMLLSIHFRNRFIKFRIEQAITIYVGCVIHS